MLLGGIQISRVTHPNNNCILTILSSLIYMQVVIRPCVILKIEYYPFRSPYVRLKRGSGRREPDNS